MSWFIGLFDTGEFDPAADVQRGFVTTDSLDAMLARRNEFFDGRQIAYIFEVTPGRDTFVRRWCATPAGFEEWPVTQQDRRNGSR